jgi:hypothetical protein
MRFILIAILPLLLAGAGSAAAKGPVVLGWLELARLDPDQLVLRGKLDTGAQNSSLHAKDVAELRRGGQPWVRFTVASDEGRTVTLERPVERIASIKRAGADAQKRYVVLLELCVARVAKRVEVNLTDRSDMTYQLLIGRSFLAGAIMVDSSATYTTRPTCVEGAR